MDREERLKKMNELLDKEDFDYKDYQELEALISDMEKAPLTQYFSEKELLTTVQGCDGVEDTVKNALQALGVSL